MSIFSTARSVWRSRPTSLASIGPRGSDRGSEDCFSKPCKRTRIFLAPLHDVRVGYDETIRGQDNAGTDAVLWSQICRVCFLVLATQRITAGQDLHHGLGNAGRQRLHRLAEDMQRIALQHLRRLGRVSRLLSLRGAGNGHNRQGDHGNQEEPGADQHAYHSTGTRRMGRR